MNIIKEALQHKLSEAEDNLCRANIAIRNAGGDIFKPYGYSGKSLLEIRRQYEQEIESIKCELQKISLGVTQWY